MLLRYNDAHEPDPMGPWMKAEAVLTEQAYEVQQLRRSVLDLLNLVPPHRQQKLWERVSIATARMRAGLAPSDSSISEYQLTLQLNAKRMAWLEEQLQHATHPRSEP